MGIKIQNNLKWNKQIETQLESNPKKYLLENARKSVHHAPQKELFTKHMRKNKTINHQYTAKITKLINKNYIQNKHILGNRTYL